MVRWRENIALNAALEKEGLAALPTGAVIELHHANGSCLRERLISVDRENGKFSTTWREMPTTKLCMTDYCLRPYPGGWNSTNWVGQP